MKGHGCSKCAHEKLANKLRKPVSKFIEQGNKKYNNIYDYSLVQYVDIQTPVRIICKKHGEFLKTPNAHISSKSGHCNICSTEKRKQK